MMVIDNKYEFGDIVFLKTDRDQFERIVIGIKVSPLGITYRVALGAIETDHYEMEMSVDKNIIIATTN